MYGTIFRMRPLPGHEEALLTVLRQWQAERQPQVPSYLAEYVFRPDAHSEELVGAVIFESREAYAANADDPEQDTWYRRLREHLNDDPTWEDGTVVYAFSSSVPSTA